MPIHLRKVSKRECPIAKIKSPKHADYNKKIQELDNKVSMIQKVYEEKLIMQIEALQLEHNQKINELSEKYNESLNEIANEHKEIIDSIKEQTEHDKANIEQKIDNNRRNSIEQEIQIKEKIIKELQAETDELPKKKPKLIRQKGIIYPKKDKTLKKSTFGSRSTRL